MQISTAGRSTLSGHLEHPRPDRTSEIRRSGAAMITGLVISGGTGAPHGRSPQPGPAVRWVAGGISEAASPGPTEIDGSR